MCAVFESKLVLTALDVRMRCEFLVRLCEGSRTSRGVPGLDPRWKTCRLYFVSPVFFRTKGCDVCMSLWISRVFQTTYVNIVQGHLFDLGNGLAVCSLVCIPSWLAGQTASSTSSTARPGRIWQDSKKHLGFTGQQGSGGSNTATAALLQGASRCTWHSEICSRWGRRALRGDCNQLVCRMIPHGEALHQ